SWQRVLWITVRDQVLLPLVQGTLWTLALAGWRHWNRGAAMQGNSLGTRIRRWWYRVNNWEIPSASPQKQKQWGSSAKVGLGREVRDVSVSLFFGHGNRTDWYSLLRPS